MPTTPRDSKDEKQAITIVGRAANPLNKENWEDDFELPTSLHLNDSYLKPSGKKKGEDVWGTDEKGSFPQLEDFPEDDPFANMSDDDDDKGKSDQIGVEDGDFEDNDSEDWDQQIEKAKQQEEIGDRKLLRDASTNGLAPNDFSGFGNDSGDEDWTNFDDAVGDEHSSSFIHLDLHDDDALDENDVKRYSLLRKLSLEQKQERYNIVTYPEPPRLYSEYMGQKVSYQDEQLVTFLSNLGPSIDENVMSEGEIKDKKSPQSDKKGDLKKPKKREGYFKRSKQYETQPPRSPQAIDIKPSFEINEKDTLPTILSKCSVLVRTLMMENPEYVSYVVEDCSKYLESNRNSENIAAFKDQLSSANLLYNMLLATAIKHQLHPIYIRTAIFLFPTYAPLFNLLKFECKAHHDGTVADLLLQSFCQLYWNQKKITDEVEAQDDTSNPRMSQEDAKLEHFSSEKETPCGQQRERDKNSLRISVAYQVQARALASLHLYLDNRSPIDWKKLSRRAQYDPLDNPSFEWLLNAYEGKPLKETADDQFRITYELCGNEIQRMKILQGLYRKIDPFESLGKAQAAFALAKYLSEGSLQEMSGFNPSDSLDRTRGNTSARTAENIAFECVIVLDKVGHENEASLKFIQSPMGVSALVLFGEILNANSKYQYAVHAFESAINVYTKMEKTRYYDMINTLSTLCEKHDDWERSLKYHCEIMEKAKFEGDLNMYVYIVQQISKIHTKAGDFLTAVKHLRSAIEVLNQCIKEKQGGPVKHHQLRGVNNALDVHNRHLARLQGLNTSRKTDFFPGVHMQEVRNQKVNLYLRLAQHFLDAKRIIEAIVVLEFLLDKEGNLPRGKISVVHLLLATAYTKKRLYGCAKELIDHMQQIAQEKKNMPMFNIPGSENVCFNAEFTPILGVSPSEVVKTREFVALCSKIEYCLGNFSNATLWTRISMKMSISNPASLTLGQRGRLHYSMGKILQGIIFQELLKCSSRDEADLVASLPDARECMDEFDKAYTFFDKVEDQVHIAKTLARIVETYLHVVFTIVALLGQRHQLLTSWFERAGFCPEGDLKSPDKSEKTWRNFLDKMEGPAHESLETALRAYHPMLYLKCLMNIAEIRFLQGKYETALKFWRECKNTFFTVAMNSERCVMVDRATPGMTSNIHSIFHRLVRMLMCFHPDMINDNLVLVDSYNLHMVELFADVEQCSPMRLWVGAEKKSEVKQQEESQTSQTGLRKQRMLHMRGIREDVDLFMNNDTEVMLETRRWLRQRKTPEPLTQEKHWRKHLSAFMGAVGSRSMSKSLHHDLAGSMMYDNYLDRESYKKAIELRDKVCSMFYQISLNFTQATAGRFSQKELTEKNRSELHSIVNSMDQLRNLTYNKSGRTGGVAGAFSPQGTPLPASQRPQLPSRRASSVWMSEFSRSSSKSGDPLWSTLTYCIPLGNILILYSPQLRAKRIRMITLGKVMEGRPSDLQIDPGFLNVAFEDFLAFQQHLKSSGNNEFIGQRKEKISNKREIEILKIGRKLGMLSENRFVSADLDSGIVRDELEKLHEESESQAVGSAHANVIDSSSGDVKFNAPTKVKLRAIRRRLPSSQFLADYDDNQSSENTINGAGSRAANYKNSRKERVGSLYDVFAEVQGFSTSTATKGAEADDSRLPSSQGDPKSSRAEKSQTPENRELRERAIKNNKPALEDEKSGYRKRTSSEITLSKLELDISCTYKSMPNSNESLVIEIFSNRDKLLSARNTSPRRWSNISVMVNMSDKKQTLWFVIRRSGRSQDFIGSQHVTLEKLMTSEKGCKLDLEDKSTLHSQPDLQQKISNAGEVGEMVLHKVQFGPPQKFQDDTLVRSLIFPDKKEENDSESNQAMVEKLVPPHFDIMLIKELLAALDRQNILALLSAMFNECQIILTSQNNFRLKAAINCLLRLMYPFHWQHTLVPLLPRPCVGLLKLKAPYLIAVNQFVFPSCIDLIPEKAIVAFLDHNQIRIRPGSFIPLPPQIKNRLSTAIQQFRVMLFRSLVTNKDPGAEGFDKKLLNTSKRSGAADSQKQLSTKGLEVKIIAPTEEDVKSATISSQKSKRLTSASIARPEASLQILKRHFLNSFVTLFYKFRLYWTGNPKQPLDVRGFLKVTKPEYLAFVRKFVRTEIFGNFIELRAALSIDQHTPSYAFDEMVYRKIYEKYQKIKSLQDATIVGKMLCQKGKGRWKMRSVEVLRNRLNVYKYNKRKGAKYTRILKPGWFQLDVHTDSPQNNNYYSFELRNVWDTEKDDSTLTFRVTSENERKDWVKAIRVRIMDSHLRLQYEFIVAKLGPRFQVADSGMADFKPPDLASEPGCAK